MTNGSAATRSIFINSSVPFEFARPVSIFRALINGVDIIDSNTFEFYNSLRFIFMDKY